jgi:hypothetical protein
MSSLVRQLHTGRWIISRNIIFIFVNLIVPALVTKMTITDIRRLRISCLRFCDEIITLDRIRCVLLGRCHGNVPTSASYLRRTTREHNVLSTDG